MKLLALAFALSSLYGNPQRVDIDGFTADAQEPCISLDGQTLYWSGKNDSDATAHIYWAKLGPNGRFKFAGRINSIFTKAREMAPSLDSSGRMYFTATETFAADHHTIYWTQGSARPRAVLGDISDGCGIDLGRGLFTLNMDCGVSPDGNTLILSRADFGIGKAGPHRSKLFFARKQADGSFRRDPNSEMLLREVNTMPLQYAPAITQDGLELYFTRLRPGEPPTTETMVAVRRFAREPFGKPTRIDAIEGFAEAPSITLDQKHLYFHQLDPVSKRFYIYRLTRHD